MANFFYVNNMHSIKVGCLMRTKEKLKLLNSMTPEVLLDNFEMGEQIPIDIVGLIQKLDIKIILTMEYY